MPIAVRAVAIVQGSREFRVCAAAIVQGSRDFRVCAVSLQTIGPTQNSTPPLIQPTGGTGSATLPTNWKSK